MPRFPETRTVMDGQLGGKGRRDEGGRRPGDSGNGSMCVEEEGIRGISIQIVRPSSDAGKVGGRTRF